jgi:hypothetical protein
VFETLIVFFSVAFLNFSKSKAIFSENLIKISSFEIIKYFQVFYLLAQGTIETSHLLSFRKTSIHGKKKIVNKPMKM